MAKKKVIHLLLEQCPNCGYTEVACGDDFIADNEENITFDDSKVTCKDCLEWISEIMEEAE